MSQIRSKNTKIELLVKEMLIRNGLRFRQHPQIFGKPDFLAGEKTLIFCDGDFWHGYKYKTKKKPAKKFWSEKIEGNMKRDKMISRKLRDDGWSVLRFWEHDIEKRPHTCLRRILKSLESN